jgi:hypothetical protein
MSLVRKSTGTLQQLSPDEKAHVTIIAPHETFTIVTAIGNAEHPNGNPGIDATWLGMKLNVVEKKRVDLGSGFFIELTTIEGHGPTLIREAKFNLDGHEVERVFIIDGRGKAALNSYYRHERKRSRHVSGN